MSSERYQLQGTAGFRIELDEDIDLEVLPELTGCGSVGTRSDGSIYFELRVHQYPELWSFVRKLIGNSSHAVDLRNPLTVEQWTKQLRQAQPVAVLCIAMLRHAVLRKLSSIYISHGEYRESRPTAAPPKATRGGMPRERDTTPDDVRPTLPDEMLDTPADTRQLGGGFWSGTAAPRDTIPSNPPLRESTPS